MTTRQKAYIAIVKRPLGFLGALVALVILSPFLMASIAVLLFANRNGFKGVFFSQERPGKDEKIFRLYKFKTMTDARDSAGQLLPDYERMTSVGSFLRKSSIDELPQLINILKGDMAFIGPRPLLVKYLDWYTPEERRRHDVNPGMTGWAQIHGRNSIGSWEQRFAYDTEYVDGISLLFDAKIFLLTVKKVFKSEDVVNPGYRDDFDVYRMKQKTAVYDKK